jgi:hypothetical protein
MNNAPGTIVEMERNQVDDNKDQTCSTGLHFCGLSYLDHFGGNDSRTVIVKIDPADVVSIPSDYNGAKGRACRYEVIGEMGVEAKDAFTASVQSNAHGTATVTASRPTKKGSTDFYRGYSDGYNEQEYDTTAGYNKDYDEGYNKGEDRRTEGLDARYEYVKPNTGAWPNPA